MKKFALLIAVILMAFVGLARADAVSSQKKMVLTLNDAILLAVRTNPNVQGTQLGYLAQKFNLHVQEWQFQPHYSFQAGITQTRGNSSGSAFGNSQNWNAQPAATLLTPIGTQVTLAGNNTNADHYNPGLSLQIMQPLMRGFGRAVVESALNNAKDSTDISKLNIEGTLRTTITAVINAYLDVVTAERTIAIDEDALKRARQSVEQTRIYIKAGHKAGNEIVTVEANVASARAQLENDRNNFLQSRYALLAAIGIDPNTDILFKPLDVEALINKYQFPTKEDAKNAVLKNDIQYQIDNITLHGSTSRALLVAEDNARWQLNATATAATGNGSGGGQNAGLNSMFNGTNQNQSVSLALQIPIDDQLSKQAIFNAKIAMKEAELNLLQEKWTKETSAINGWNQVVSAKNSQRFADAESLQQKTYTVNYQKYLHGLIDSLELQSAQLQLIQSQQTLLSSRISYLKSLANLDLLMGNTLKTWDVKVRL